MEEEHMLRLAAERERDAFARQLEEAREEIRECHLSLDYACWVDGCKWCLYDDEKEAGDEERA